jgi:hypothetical protein
VHGMALPMTETLEPMHRALAALLVMVASGGGLFFGACRNERPVRRHRADRTRLPRRRLGATGMRADRDARFRADSSLLDRDAQRDDHRHPGDPPALHAGGQSDDERSTAARTLQRAFAIFSAAPIPPRASLIPCAATPACTPADRDRRQRRGRGRRHEQRGCPPAALWSRSPCPARCRPAPMPTR